MGTPDLELPSKLCSPHKELLIQDFEHGFAIVTRAKSDVASGNQWETRSLSAPPSSSFPRALQTEGTQNVSKYGSLIPNWQDCPYYLIARMRWATGEIRGVLTLLNDCVSILCASKFIII
jgi:hypothetical protein